MAWFDCPNCDYSFLLGNNPTCPRCSIKFNECPDCGEEWKLPTSLPCITCNNWKKTHLKNMNIKPEEGEVNLGYCLLYDEEKEENRLPLGIMLYNLFPKGDQRRNYKGYDFVFRPGEFSNNPNKEMHIHVIGEEGSMKVRLKPVERDESQNTDISGKNQRKLIEFVKIHLPFIKSRIIEVLETRKIKVNQPF